MAFSVPLDSRVLCASFNQDNSCFAVGTKDGVRLFDARTGRLRYERVIGAFRIVEMLFSTSLIAMVGAGEQPSLSPRRLCLFNFVTENAVRELNFLTTILAVRLNRKRLIVVLQEKAYIYDVNSLAILDSIDTVVNNRGICAFSPNSESCYLALPASTTNGSVLVYNTIELQSLCQIDAHRSPITAVAFSSNGTYLATASEQGTIIRVHLVSQATKSYSLRRGTYPSTIYSLSFGPSVDLPEILVATSLPGSLHVFSLEPIIERRNKRPDKLLGSMIPETINDAFEPSYHHVIHNVSLPGVKSYVAISSMEKVSGNSSGSTIRSNVYIITRDGDFYDYALTFRSSSDLSWNLERKLNVANALIDDSI